MSLSTLRTSITVVGALGALALGAGTVAAQPDATQHDYRAKAGALRDGNVWLLNDELDGGSADNTFVYGRSGDLHVMGDWNGDGTRTAGVARAESDRLVWYLNDHNAAGAGETVVTFGEVRNAEDFDLPVVGDWNGDGRETIGVVRYHGGNWLWLLDNDLDGDADHSFVYGRPYRYGTHDPDRRAGVPVVGDWDGDGMTTAGVVVLDPQADTARWLLTDANSDGAADHAFFYGNGRDMPLTGDWDGDSVVTPGVVRDGNRWLLRNGLSGGAADLVFHYGEHTDVQFVWR